MCEQPGHVNFRCPEKISQTDMSQKQNDNAIVFLGENSTFSNFNKSYPVLIDDVMYSSNEQYIQCEKAKMFRDNETVRKIMSSSNPKEIKELGKTVRNFDNRKWKHRRNEVVRVCNEAKYEMYEEAKRELLETGQKLLGEATRDTHWGVGIHISDEGVLYTETWIGGNEMGNILMSIRKAYQTEESTDKLIQDVKGLEQNESLRQWAVVVGDSNVRGVVLEDVPYKVEKRAVSGTGVSDVEGVIQDIQAPPKEVGAFLLHVGTCDFDIQSKNNVDNIYTEYVEVVNHVSMKYPDANILISGIPQRAPRIQRPQQQRLNHEVGELNAKLQALCENEQYMWYIDNDNGLLAYGEVSNSLYRESDKTGVHLNEQGLAILADNFRQSLIEVHYKSKLEKEYDVIPKTIDN